MSELDLRKPDDLLFITDTEWRELGLPVSVAWRREQLLRFMMDHTRIPAMHRAAFWTAQQMTQRPVERMKTLQFPDMNGSQYTKDGWAVPEVAALKGRNPIGDVPPSMGGRGWVSAECFATSLYSDAKRETHTYTQPNLHGGPSFRPTASPLSPGTARSMPTIYRPAGSP